MNNAQQTSKMKTPLWVTAQSKHNKNRQQKVANAVTKKHYFEVLEQMKQLYKAKGDELAFERDYTIHASDKPNTMHCFLTNEFYWQLCCTDDCDFVIWYNASDLPFLADFNKMCVYRPKSARAEVTQELPISVMFKRCKRLQDSKLFTIL